MDTIDSKTNHVGEMFRATLNSPLRVNGRIVIPQGAEAIGRLTVVEQGGRIRGHAKLALELTANDRATAAPYYTEGSIYNEAGIPTVICGPGDIDQAHRPNEFITHEQMERGLPLLSALIERICMQ